MRCSDLEKVGVRARGSDRRAGAGPLHVRNTSYPREVSEYGRYNYGFNQSRHCVRSRAGAEARPP